jgi:cytochrome c
MDDRFNTAAGWVLFSGIVALGLSSISAKVFDTHRPETMGYPIEVADTGGEEDAGPDLGTLLAAADVANGAQKAAARCGTCHTFDQGGADGQGPNLYAIMGAQMGAKPGFGYSQALTGKGEPWSWEAMNEWILSPRGYMSGTSMSFAGLKNNEERADIVAYLNTLGSNLPLPEPVVAEEAEIEADAEGAAEADAEQDAAAEIEEAAE